jgi:hypothetical protein
MAFCRLFPWPCGGSVVRRSRNVRHRLHPGPICKQRRRRREHRGPARGEAFFVGAVVAEHGPEDVDTAAGEGEHCLFVAFAFGSLALEVGFEAVLCWMLISAEA